MLSEAIPGSPRSEAISRLLSAEELKKPKIIKLDKEKVR